MATTPKKPLSARGNQQQLQYDGRQETHTTSNEWPNQLPVSRRCNDRGELQNDLRTQTTPLQDLGRFLVFAEQPVRHC